jgi:hypothetical protein
LGQPNLLLQLLVLVVLEDARVHSAQYLLVAGRDGAVAEGLERQDRERLLDLDADLVRVRIRVRVRARLGIVCAWHMHVRVNGALCPVL